MLFESYPTDLVALNADSIKSTNTFGMDFGYYLVKSLAHAGPMPQN